MGVGGDASSSAASTAAAADDHVSPVIGRSGRTSDTLGWQDPPVGLQLVQAHHLVRHGPRTPVRVRMQNADPPIPAIWNMCHVGKQFRSAVMDVTDDRAPYHAQSFNRRESLRGSRVDVLLQKSTENTGHDGQTILQPAPGDCMLGELTDLGRAETNLLGSRLRNLYIDKLGLLPETVTAADADKFYLRSTNMERTIASLHSVVGGLFPQFSKDTSDYAHDKHRFIPTVRVRNGVSENLLPNTFGCARLRHLDRMFSDLAAKLHNPTLAALDSKLAPQLDGHVPRVDGHPRLSGVLDTVRAAATHGLAIPSVFEEKPLIDAVERAVCDEWYGGYRAEDKVARDQFRRLAMGRFLLELSGRLNEKANKPAKTPLQMAIYSAHDTSVAGVLSTLDVFDNRWPAFTAVVGFELFKASSNSHRTLWQRLGLVPDTHYVRVRYGDKEMHLPSCQADGDHLPGHREFCTLDAFSRAVNSLRHPSGLAWEHECDQASPAKAAS